MFMEQGSINFPLEKLPSAEMLKKSKNKKKQKNN